MIDLKVPEHIGIIMDGNGRWAKEQGKPRSFGHTAGLEAAKRIAKAASDLGVRYLSLYTFSTENWKRSEAEVSFLMQLLKIHLKQEYNFYKENHIKVVHSGYLQKLPAAVQKELKEVENITSAFDGLTVNLAINYGGRDEIIRAVKKFNESGEKDITEEKLSSFMDHPEIPDPDLIIRTAGEMRLSNFMLWECAYSELYCSRKFWPDWDKKDLEEAILNYNKRNRKFGAVTEGNI